jgi:hypothetical protein
LYGPKELFVALILGVVFGVIYGLTSGLGVGSLNNIALVESMSWEWKQFWLKTIPGVIAGVIGGPMVVLISVVLGWSSGLHALLKHMYFVFLHVGLGLGMTWGLIGGLISGLTGGFTNGVMLGKASPNQGIKLSLRNSLIAYLITCLIFAPIFALIFGVSSGVFCGVVTGTIFALIIGLNRGASAVVKHYALRLILSMQGYTPLNFVKLLDECNRLILLKKVGSGYVFVHGMFRDYFAEMNRESTKPGNPGSVLR